MPQPRRQHPALRRRVFRARDAIGRGLVTAEQLRGPAWRRVLHGVYADAILPLDHGLKARAAALALPPGAALTGVSAAWLWGVHFAADDDPVDVVGSPGGRLRTRPGLRVRTSALPGDDLDALSGVTLTGVPRTVWELAQRLDPVEAVVYADALVRLGRVDAAGLAEYLATRQGWYGSRAAEAVFQLADGRSESPPESRLRIHLIRAGLRPVPQYEIWHRGRFVARVDLGWPDAKVAVEYDGVWHADRAQLARDRLRLNRLLAAGWYVHHVTADDMRDLTGVITAIRRALRR